MTGEQYNERVVSHFLHPRHHGYFDPGPDIIAGCAGNRADGVEFKFTARIAREQVIAVRFQAYGCPHAIAAASWLTEHLVGASLEQLAQWHWREVAQELDVPTTKRGRLLILEDAVHALAENWQRKAQNRLE